MEPIRVLDELTKFSRGGGIQDLAGLPRPLTTDSEEWAEQSSRGKMLGTCDPKERLEVGPDRLRSFAWVALRTGGVPP
jgi:hypothetical protein